MFLSQLLVPTALPTLGHTGDAGATARMYTARRQMCVIRVSAEALQALKLHGIVHNLLGPSSTKALVLR
eukprot:scaffold250916_cov33-Tisochrysis_lutea.AAC.2